MGITYYNSNPVPVEYTEEEIKEKILGYIVDIDGELKVQVFGRGLAWLDTGTHDSLAEASTFVEVIEKRQGLKVACLEGIAYRNGWISEERMREIAQPMLKNQYGQYLLKVIDEMKEEVNSRTLTQD